MKNKVGSKTKSPGRQPNTASSIIFFHLNKWLTESIDQAPVWLKRGKTKERTSFLLTHRLWEAVLNLRRWINKGSKTAAVVDPRSLKCLQTGWFLLTWWCGMLPKTDRYTCSRAWHWVSQLLLGYRRWWAAFESRSRAKGAIPSHKDFYHHWVCRQELPGWFCRSNSKSARRLDHALRCTETIPFHALLLGGRFLPA